MEDYIFLIIAVLITIFSALNKKKKKEEAAQLISEDADEKPDNFSFEQLFSDDFDGFKQVREQVTPPKIKVKTPVAPVSPVSGLANYHSSYKSTLPESHIAVKKSQPKKQLERTLEPEEDFDDAPEYLEDFSLRKAVIYSEILNPKYQD